MSVLIPTIGRPAQLSRALASLAACKPGPTEILVVDQSKGVETEAVVKRSVLRSARVVRSAGTGRGLAVNEGFRAASSEIVMVVDDDCTVDPDWVAAGLQAMARDPGAIVCGQVLPAGGDPRRIPSTIALAHPVDYTGQVRCDVLYAGNMVCGRDEILSFGEFDPRIVPAAEDCDLCYRWLKAGRVLRHDPALVVHHHDWRSPTELRRHYVRYYEGQGRFYAKHLRGGDLGVLKPLSRDVYAAGRGAAAGMVHRVPAWADHRRGIPRGLFAGFRAGWREFRGERGRVSTA